MLSKIKKIRISKYDKIWSRTVRERDNFTCQVCGRYDTTYSAAHHILRRGIKSTRLQPFNGITLCPGCHVFSHKFSAHRTPEAFKRWFEERFSERANRIHGLERVYKTERQAIKEFIEKYET